ncbi:MAG TPA: DUF6781 family protein [Burkholderiales bacterium]|nr:DUF6781 family protein [Burkholderiales bacterium]
MDVGKQIEDAIREGQRVQEAVQEITLKALTERQLDFAAMRKVTSEAIESIRQAAATQDPGLMEAARQALSGVGRALGEAGQAAKLSAEEAAASSQLVKAARAQLEAGVRAGAASGAVFARAAAGMLAGLADALENRHKR